MNNVAGAIHAAGARQLKEFTWGGALANMINSLVDDLDPPITTETTGKGIIKLLDRMDDGKKNLILSYPISFVDEKGDLFFDIDEVENEGSHSKPHHYLLTFVALLAVVISIITTILPSTVAFNDDGSVSESFTKVFEAIIKLLP